MPDDDLDDLDDNEFDPDAYRYDPDVAPEPDDWLALDEAERIQLVEAYHRKAGIRTPNEHLHATIQVIVENQVAMGVEAVCENLDRLQGEGLSRHEALHAVAQVMAEHIHDLFNSDPDPAADPNVPYQARLYRITARGWRSGEPEA